MANRSHWSGQYVEISVDIAKREVGKILVGALCYNLMLIDTFNKHIERRICVLQRMMVDEADVDLVGAAVRSGGGGGGMGGKRAESPRAVPPKRKAGPLPHHVRARRPSSPAPQPRSPEPRAPLSPLSPLPPLSPLSPQLPQPPQPPVTPPPAAPLSPVTMRRPASPLAPVPSDLPSGRPPEVRCRLFLIELMHDIAGPRTAPAACRTTAHCVHLPS